MLIFAVLFLMLLLVSIATPTFINWGLFILVIIQMAFIIKGDNKPSTMRCCYWSAIVIRSYTCVILLGNILFICLVGTVEKTNQPDSLDQWIKSAFPQVYNRLDFIGLRVYKNEDLSVEEMNQQLKNQFFMQLAYLVMSIYLEKIFEVRMEDSHSEQERTETDYALLFNFNPYLDPIQNIIQRRES
jgi:hypothetical protein